MKTMREEIKALAEVLNYTTHHDGNPYIAPNMKEVDQFGLAATNFCSYRPDHTGYASFKVGKYHQGSNYLLYWDGTGIFYYRDWDNHKMKVRFFTFAICKHEMEHTARLGNCYNEYRCKKCGYVNTIDSSD